MKEKEPFYQVPKSLFRLKRDGIINTTTFFVYMLMLDRAKISYLKENISKFTDEDGKDTMFEFLDLIKYEENEYIVLSPIYEEDEEIEDEGHVVILRLDEETEDGGETYSSVDDDSIIEAVYNIFKDKWKNKYNFID